ncbi:methyltransferase [Pilimelia anulata]|uniref:Methyltransferase n=1 Tax=Pilimelia anulata TaxID=53371 RepID=A0A8J3BF03_9ACTN|nr:methyltransferase domain-containing protein [Pilimelia anulata]GGJ99169.1 methyltransferase [Pilimelia anulata]
MDPDLLAALRSPAGTAALAAAGALAGTDPLAAAAALRAAGTPPELAAAALTQAELRRRAAAKFGADAGALLYTRPGLEQATRRVVADRRAARLAAAGVRRLADLGCGLGADALAAARAGIAVLAVEADPGTAALARHNAAALGLADRVEVRCADAAAVDLSGYDAVFCDPARRRGGSRVFDPAAYSPPWDFVAALPGRVPRTALKLAPGIDHALLPPGAEGEWVSVGGELVEAAAWCGPLAAVPRRATVLPAARAAAAAGTVVAPAAELVGGGDRVAPVRAVGRYLYDPDPAVVRAHLVAEFADTVAGWLADERVAYVYTDTPHATPYGRGIALTDVLPFGLKRLRAHLRERGIGRLEIMKRSSPLEPDALRRRLGLSGPHGATLVLTRIGDAPMALLGQPLPR